MRYTKRVSILSVILTTFGYTSTMNEASLRAIAKQSRPKTFSSGLLRAIALAMTLRSREPKIQTLLVYYV